jgi:hypothetical protein
LPAGQMPSDNVPAEKNEAFKKVEFSDVFLLSRIKLKKTKCLKMSLGRDKSNQD